MTEKHILAVTQALHPRLGEKSGLADLGADLIQMILKHYARCDHTHTVSRGHFERHMQERRDGVLTNSVPPSSFRYKINLGSFVVSEGAIPERRRVFRGMSDGMVLFWSPSDGSVCIRMSLTLSTGRAPVPFVRLTIGSISPENRKEPLLRETLHVHEKILADSETSLCRTFEYGVWTVVICFEK